MLKKNFIVIAILSLVMVSTAFAQPAQKQTRTKAAGIWGMETGFGSVIKTPRSNGIGGGIGGGAIIGGAVMRTQTPRRAPGFNAKITYKP